MIASLVAASRVQVWDIIAAFFTGSADPIELLSSAANWRSLVIWLVVLAGLSEAIGQSVVLFANQVKPMRFVLSLLISALLNAVNFLIWVTLFWLFSTRILAAAVPSKMLFIVIGVSYIPLLLGFLGFLPYAGQPILQILYVWSYGLMAVYIGRLDGVEFNQAVSLAVIGLVSVLFIRALTGRLLDSIAHWAMDVTSGRKLMLDVNEAVTQITLAMTNNKPDAPQSTENGQSDEGKSS
ncbi:MAG: hypothetical protein H6642_16350 [Caldilineaceae bacterium]|nr:hypothetical protein [Caldilineaceae bacterium]